MHNHHGIFTITQNLVSEPEAEILIDLRRVTKCYNGPAGVFTALDDIDLQVEKGEFVGIVGKSGSGKSTLLNILTGIDRTSTGEVYVAGTAVHDLSQNRSAIWRGQTVGVIFQFFQLLPTLTVLENVMLPISHAWSIVTRSPDLLYYDYPDQRTKAYEKWCRVFDTTFPHHCSDEAIYSEMSLVI